MNPSELKQQEEERPRGSVAPFGMASDAGSQLERPSELRPSAMPVGSQLQPQHMPHASVPAIPLAAVESESEMNERLDKMSKEVEKMRQAEGELKKEDYGAVLDQTYEMEIKQLEADLDKEKQEKEQAQQALERQLATNNSLEFRAKSLEVALAEARNAKRQGLRREKVTALNMQTQTVDPEIAGADVMKEAGVANPNMSQEDRKLIESAIAAAQSEEMKGGPSQLLGRVLANVVDRQHKEKEKTKTKTKPVDKEQMTKGFAQFETKVTSLGENVAEALRKQESAVSGLRGTVNSVCEKMLSVRKLQQRLIRESEKTEVLQTKVNELETQLERKRSEAAATAENVGPERSVDLPKVESARYYGTQEFSGIREELGLSRARSADEKLWSQAVSTVRRGKEDLLRLQQYQTVLGKEKMIVENSAFELGKKKREMVVLMRELEAKNKKIKRMNHEIGSLKGQYFPPARGYKLILGLLLGVIMVLLYPTVGHALFRPALPL